MTAPAAVRDVLAALSEHRPTFAGAGPGLPTRCSCGEAILWAEYRAHLAAVLAPLLDEAAADGWVGRGRELRRPVHGQPAPRPTRGRDVTAEALAYEFSRAQSRVRAMFGDEAAERILSEAMRRHAERGWEWQRVVDWLDGLNGSEAPR